MQYNDTLCWKCRNATGNCSWSERLEPVKGWTAELAKKTATKPYDTYLVRKCPEFISDDQNQRKEV